MTVVSISSARVPAGFIVREVSTAHVTVRLRLEGRTLRLACVQSDCEWGAWCATRSEAARLARQHDRRKHGARGVAER